MEGGDYEGGTSGPGDDAIRLGWSQNKWGLFVMPTLHRYSEVLRATELEEIGFVWNHIDSEVYFFRSLRTASPTKLMAPSDDSWPERSWDFRLGSVVDNIHAYGWYQDEVPAINIDSWRLDLRRMTTIVSHRLEEWPDLRPILIGIRSQGLVSPHNSCWKLEFHLKTPAVKWKQSDD